tara:strand:- start:2144 stop:2461 length:318 start_codon:yes stop_codon:yes gene_type:complete
MSTTLCIHILWSSVASAALFLTFKCVEKYTNLKSLEVIAIGSEKFAFTLLQILKHNPELLGRRITVGNKTNQQPAHVSSHYGTTQEKETNNHCTTSQRCLFDIGE